MASFAGNYRHFKLLVAYCSSGPLSVKFSNFLLSNNAFVANGSGALISLQLGSYPGLNFSGNAYWSVPRQEEFMWDGDVYTSLGAFRNATGQERDFDGTPTGTDADPFLATSNSFFQSCVDWHASYPLIPNSAMLDLVRRFSGCP